MIIFVVYNHLIMNTIDCSKPVRFKNPLQGEEGLIFNVSNFNEVTRRCYIQLVSSMPGINPNIAPQELVSVDDLINVE
jgi:hypothetical protein